ncbi:MAG: hypothetical protein ACREBU_23535 [Nitrososphaera sp.]
MDRARDPQWSIESVAIPRSVNDQLVGTFPSIVRDEKGRKTCAFFVRAAEEDLFKRSDNRESAASSYLRPQFVRTPQGPLIVVHCMAKFDGQNPGEPFMSETAIFPRLPSMPLHRTICEMLASNSEAFFVICDARGNCLFNSKAKILESWRKELADKAKDFDEGKQITDEKTAIMSLYWYQEKYNPTARIFEIR